MGGGNGREKRGNTTELEREQEEEQNKHIHTHIGDYDQKYRNALFATESRKAGGPACAADRYQWVSRFQQPSGQDVCLKWH